jgi:hypothetical protein
MKPVLPEITDFIYRAAPELQNQVGVEKIPPGPGTGVSLLVSPQVFRSTPSWEALDVRREIKYWRSPPCA